jgi:hypothetical protein
MAEVTAHKRSTGFSSLDGQVVAINIPVDATSTGGSASDTITLCDIDAGTIIPLECIVEVTTADGETATADIGLKPTTGSAFTADPNGLNDAVDLNSAAISAGAVGTDAQMGSKISATDGATLYMTLDHDIEDCIFNVTFVYVIVDH